MKKFLLIISLHQVSPFTFYVLAQQGEWAWMHGSNSTNDIPEWGTQGIPSSANTPAGTYAPQFWQDLQGNFWIYGGYSTQGHRYGAMWKYDPLSNEWTWMSGSNNNLPSPVYGTQGVFDANNTPGQRAFCAVSWTDNNGKFWFYGGDGNNGVKADLWQYDPDILQWAWMAGTTSAGVNPVYGTFQLPAAGNTPGSRRESNAAWVDIANNLWLYGGQGNNSNKADMWKFDRALNQWAWMEGPTNNNSNAVYGMQGVFDAANNPGARSAYSKFTRADGTFWLFGGGVYTANKLFNDLWQYDPSINQWAWISGTNQENALDSSGAKCDSSAYYVPNSRYESRSSVTDSCGNFWIFGGVYDLVIDNMLNDLWIYRPSAGDWTYVTGDLNYNQTGIYGTQGVFDPANKPGSRMGAPMWIDKDGSIWLFGGNDTDILSDLRNDMWKFIPDSSCPAISCISLLLPSSAFSSSDTSACENDCIDFSDLSTNDPTSWQWEFPGGVPSSSTNQNPTNICYNFPGIYDVTLIVSNGNGNDTLVMSNLITVNSTPAASIAQSNDTLYASTGYYYHWYFDGNTISGATDFFYVASSQGNYSVEVTDSNGCSAFVDYLFQAVAFSSSDTTLCEKFCIDFFDQSFNNPVAWQWNFPGANPSSSSSQNPANICYDNPGVFDVTLITTNANGISDTLFLTDFITVFTNPFAPLITQDGNLLTVSPAQSYQWQLNGVDIPGATNQSYEITESGLYTVIVNDENGCIAQSSIDAGYVGVEDVEVIDGVNIYPNPSNGNFMIELPHDFMDQRLSIHIINTLGQEVFSSVWALRTSSEKIEIDLNPCRDVRSCVSTGIYFIEIKSGSTIIRHKLILTR